MRHLKSVPIFGLIDSASFLRIVLLIELSSWVMFMMEVGRVPATTSSWLERKYQSHCILKGSS